MFLWGHHASSEGAGPQRPHIFGILYLRSNGLTYRATKFGVITHMGSSVFPWGQLRPRQRYSSVPSILEIPYLRAHSMRNNNQILTGDQTSREENFYRVDHECCSREICLRELTFLFIFP